MGSIGPPEILIVILVLVLLFGAKKLPELARGSGRAIRIFKSETKGLMDDDDDDDTPSTTRPQQQLTQDVSQPQQPQQQPQQQYGQSATPTEPLPPTHREN
jgi:sec-independent protein translocase protein TatA